jgi:hypothetical protein
MATDKPRLIDQRPASARHKDKEMQVLVLSMPRTGTKSLKFALDYLGIKTYHASVAIAKGDLPCWNEALAAKYDGQGKPYSPTDWEKILGGFQGISDAPATLFTDEHLANYPHAKVIITHRDVEKWYNSYQRTAIPTLTWPSWKFLLLFKPERIGAWYHFACTFLNNLSKPGYYNTTAQPDLWTRENFRRAYESHYEHVRSVVPAERLLDFHITDGWRPLCEFLSKDIPPADVPFPHLNASEHSDDMGNMLAAMWRTLVWEAAGNALRFGAPVVAAAIGAGWWYRRRK